MKLSLSCSWPVLVAVLRAGRCARRRRAGAAGASRSSRQAAEAYAQFLLGQHLEDRGRHRRRDRGVQARDRSSTRRRPTSRPSSPTCSCGRAASTKRSAAAEQALKVAPANREAHRVLGIVYATLVESGRRAQLARSAGADREPEQGDPASRAGARAAEWRTRPQRARDAGAAVHFGASRSTRRFRCSSISSTRNRAGGRPRAAGAGVRERRPQRRSDRLARRCRRRRSRICYQRWPNFYERERRWNDAANAYAAGAQERAAQLRAASRNTRRR